MRFMKLQFAAMVIAASSLAAPAHADDDIACGMIAAAIGAGVGYTLGAPVGGAIQAMSIAAGGYGGVAGLSSRCNQSLEDLIEHYIRNPIDYDDFVRNHCGGNPLNCPGNLNPYSPWTSQPWGCGSLLVQCAMLVIRGPGGHGPFTSVSVNDILNAMTFVDISLGYGNWASDYSYLVGVHGGVLTP